MVNIKIPNRVLYTFIAIVIIIAIIGVVYAIAPSPGHDADEIGPGTMTGPITISGDLDVTGDLSATESIQRSSFNWLGQRTIRDYEKSPNLNRYVFRVEGDNFVSISNSLIEELCSVHLGNPESGIGGDDGCELRLVSTYNGALIYYDWRHANLNTGYFVLEGGSGGEGKRWFSINNNGSLKHGVNEDNVWGVILETQHCQFTDGNGYTSSKSETDTDSNWVLQGKAAFSNDECWLVIID